MTEHHFALSYEPPIEKNGEKIWRGQTESEAIKKVENAFPNKDILLTWNTVYFFSPSNRAPIDFVMIDGVVLSQYAEHLERPIIAFREGEVTIFEKTAPDLYDRFGLSAYENFLKSHEAKKFDHAFAGDFKPTKPENKTARRIIGLRGSKVVFIPLFDADWEYCKKEIAEQQLDSWIYLDGGSSVSSKAKTPVHLSVLQDKPPVREFPLIGIFYILT